MNINKVVLSGRLTRDPEQKVTASGANMLRLSVAVNERRRNPRTEEWEDVPNYIDCTMYGSAGSSRTQWLAEHLAKGSHVTVDGKLRFSQWEKDGMKRSKLEVIANDVDFAPVSAQAEGRQNVYTLPEAEEVGPYDNDDIPF